MFQKLEIKFHLILLSSSIIIGTMSSSWMILWIMMEINTPSFSMFMMDKKEKSKNPINYFIIQSSCSLIILTSIILSSQNMSKFKTLSNPFTLINLMAMAKMGMMPTHNWIIKMMMNLSFSSILILTTIQKILPMKILTMSNPTLLTKLSTILNITISPLLMIPMTKSKQILAISSMYNLAWITTNIQSNKTTSIIYLITYCLINASLIKNIEKNNLKSINPTMKPSSPSTILLILNMAGIPPTWGFTIKLMMIQSMINDNPQTMLILTLLSSNMLMMIKYLSLILPKSMKQNKNYTKLKTNFPMIILNMASPLMILLTKKKKKKKKKN